MMKWVSAPLLLVVGTSACSNDAADRAGFPVTRSGEMQGANARGAGEMSPSIPDAQPVSRDEWVGRWIGVEGLNLTISKAAKPGWYRLAMQYGTDTDMAGSFEGIGTPEGIAFARPDGEQVLRAATGNETGLKYLAGKSDCLKVKIGEGYCRR